MHRLSSWIKGYLLNRHGLSYDVKHFITDFFPWFITEAIPSHVKRIAPKFAFGFVWHLIEMFDGVLKILDGILKILSLGFIKKGFSVKWSKLTFSYLSRLRERLLN